MSKKDVTMLVREFPRSLSAEAAVLGSILIDPPCFAEAAELLCIEAFYHFENRAIYEGLLQISNRGDGQYIDAVLLRDELVTLSELLLLAYDAIEMRDPNSLTGLSTGFYQLDEITCGLQKGDVIIVAARPSDKTDVPPGIVTI